MQPEGDDTASSPDAADAGSSRTAQYQTLPLSTVAQLGQIGDRATFRPFRQSAKAALHAYFSGDRDGDEVWSHPSARKLVPEINRLLRNVGRSPGRTFSSPHRIEDSIPPPLRKWREGEEVFECCEEFWAGALLHHRESLARYGVNVLLQRALQADKIAFADPMWLTFSAFGIDSEIKRELGTERGHLYETPISPIVGDSLRVGCFGAGLHDEAGYFETMARQTDPTAAIHELTRRESDLLSTLEFAARMRAVQEELFGPIAATCYEVREMLALWFCKGERDGEIHVFDDDPRVAQSLADPRFAVTNAFDPKIREIFFGASGLPGHLRRYFELLAQGRPTVAKTHGLMPNGEELRSWSFDLNPKELSKIQMHQLDMVTDPFPELAERLDLSFWLNVHYFLTEKAALIVFAKILRQTKVGGYIVTDYFAGEHNDTNDVAMLFDTLGVKIVEANRNSFMGGRVTTNLMQKVADTEPLTLLASLRAPK